MNGYNFRFQKMLHRFHGLCTDSTDIFSVNSVFYSGNLCNSSLKKESAKSVLNPCNPCNPYNVVTR